MRYTISILLVSLLVSCGTAKTPLPTDNIDELLGAWTNVEYESKGLYGRFVWKADDTLSIYRRIADQRSLQNHDYKVEEKWRIRGGSTMFKITTVGRQSRREEGYLIRVNPEGDSFEYMFYRAGVSEDFPTEIDPDSRAYGTYYRPK